MFGEMGEDGFIPVDAGAVELSAPPPQELKDKMTVAQEVAQIVMHLHEIQRHADVALSYEATEGGKAALRDLIEDTQETASALGAVGAGMTIECLLQIEPLVSESTDPTQREMFDRALNLAAQSVGMDDADQLRLAFAAHQAGTAGEEEGKGESE